MTTLTIQIAEDRLEQLKEVARREGVAPEELVRARLEEWLSNRPTDFDQAAKYVLDKNNELYRRLSHQALKGRPLIARGFNPWRRKPWRHKPLAWHDILILGPCTWG